MSGQSVPLEQTCDFLSGYAWSAANFEAEPVGLPIIRIQNVDAVRNSDFVYWPGEYEERFVVRSGDLLLTLSGSFRAVVWQGPDALLNQRIVKLTPKPGYSLDWLLHVLRNGLNTISGLGRHALVSNVALADLRQLKVPSQTSEEQRRIAAILDQAETLRTQRRAALAQLDSLTQSLFLDMFGDPVANPKFPVGTIRQFVEANSGKSSKLVLSECPTDIPIYGGNGINGWATAPLYEQPVLVFGRVGQQCGNAFITEGLSWVTDNAIVIRITDASKLIEKYILHAFQGSDFSNRVKHLDLPFINQGMILDNPIPIPPLALQQTFATRIQAIESLKTTHRSALTELDELFASLQQRAFAGEL